MIHADAALAAGAPARADERYAEVASLAKEIGRTELWIDALCRRAWAALDASDARRAYEALTRAGAHARALGDAEAEVRVRAQVIYFQLLEHRFEVEGDTYSALLDSLGARPSPASIVCRLFRADVSAARGLVAGARAELARAREGAVRLEEHALLIPIGRREAALGAALGAPPEERWARAFALGATLPPEVGARRRAPLGR